MPANTNRKVAQRKTNPLPEMAKGVTRTTDKKVKGLAYETRPVHEPQDKRLPQDESAYLHKARETVAPLSKGQLHAIDAFKRGVGLPEIAKSTGLPSQTLKNTLKPHGLSEETHKKQLQQLADWYSNRRNP